MKYGIWLFFFWCVVFGPALSEEPLSLVESYPVGTDFDQADIPDTREVWLELIKSAEEEIRWHTFYVAHEPGEYTESVLQALREAAGRGVKVKLLVDPKFRDTYPEPLNGLDALSGVEVRNSPIGRWFGGVMHAKMILVDDKVGFLGSQNFDWRSLEHIRELGVVFRDPRLVEFYARHFDWEWVSHKAEAPPDELPDVDSGPFEIGGETVLPTSSPNALNREEAWDDEYQIVKLLNESQDSVDIALLSYSPVTHDGHRYYAALDNAIRSAAVQGVKVRLLLSHWVETKDTVEHLRSLDVLENVEVRACRIPLTAEGEIPFARVHHSKYLVVDGERAWLGTSNWAEGYFHDSRNYGMVFLDGTVPERLDQLFEYDWARSTQLELGGR